MGSRTDFKKLAAQLKAPTRKVASEDTKKAAEKTIENMTPEEQEADYQKLMAKKSLAQEQIAAMTPEEQQADYERLKRIQEGEATALDMFEEAPFSSTLNATSVPMKLGVQYHYTTKEPGKIWSDFKSDAARNALTSQMPTSEYYLSDPYYKPVGPFSSAFKKAYDWSSFVDQDRKPSPERLKMMKAQGLTDEQIRDLYTKASPSLLSDILKGGVALSSDIASDPSIITGVLRSMLGAIVPKSLLAAKILPVAKGLATGAHYAASGGVAPVMELGVMPGAKKLYQSTLTGLDKATTGRSVFGKLSDDVRELLMLEPKNRTVFGALKTKNARLPSDILWEEGSLTPHLTGDEVLGDFVTRLEQNRDKIRQQLASQWEAKAGQSGDTLNMQKGVRYSDEEIYRRALALTEEEFNAARIGENFPARAKARQALQDIIFEDPSVVGTAELTNAEKLSEYNMKLAAYQKKKQAYDAFMKKFNRVAKNPKGVAPGNYRMPPEPIPPEPPILTKMGGERTQQQLNALQRANRKYYMNEKEMFTQGANKIPDIAGTEAAGSGLYTALNEAEQMAIDKLLPGQAENFSKMGKDMASAIQAKKLMTPGYSEVMSRQNLGFPTTEKSWVSKSVKGVTNAIPEVVAGITSGANQLRNLNRPIFDILAREGRNIPERWQGATEDTRSAYIMRNLSDISEAEKAKTPEGMGNHFRVEKIMKNLGSSDPNVAGMARNLIEDGYSDEKIYQILNKFRVKDETDNEPAEE